MDENQQRKLASAQVEEFYHDLFVETQVQHFAGICAPLIGDRHDVVADVGGGCGYFAAAVSRDLGYAARVIDMDPVSVERARTLGVDAVVGDALALVPRGDEAAACFNLILHHLVGGSEKATRQLQMSALSQWRASGALVFVNEYIYDSWLANASGRIIFAITSSRMLSKLASLVAKVVPSLRANTFGVGVRFRSAKEWHDLFVSNGWQVCAVRKGDEEQVSIARRLLLIRSCRRDSYVLRNAAVN